MALRRLWVCVGLCALGLCSACARTPAASAQLRARLSRQGHARVLLVADRATHPSRRLAALGLRPLRSGPGFAALDVDADQLDRLLAAPDHPRLGLDRGGGGHLLEALPLAGVAQARSAGARGQGVAVALLDTGVDASHPDLAGRIADEACFCSGGCCPNGADTQLGPGSAHDDNGHGTHLAGVIASQGAVGPLGGAPDASLVAVKVLDRNNTFCCTSDLLAALAWVDSEHPEVRVVNLSLGLSTLYSGDCDDADPAVASLAAAIDALHARGVLVVASSGNQGSTFSLAAPACIKAVLSVGAVWDASLGPQLALGCSQPQTAADQVACFSNESLTLDLLAPGALITASWPGPGTLTRAGTSPAAAIVSACAADLWSVQPDLDVDTLQAALRASGRSVLDTRVQRSHPRLDCAAARASLTPAADGGTLAPDAAALGGDAADGGTADAGASAGAGSGAAGTTAGGSAQAGGTSDAAAGAWAGAGSADGQDAAVESAPPAASTTTGAMHAGAPTLAADGGEGPAAPRQVNARRVRLQHTACSVRAPGSHDAASLPWCLLLAAAAVRRRRLRDHPPKKGELRVRLGRRL